MYAFSITKISSLFACKTISQIKILIENKSLNMNRNKKSIEKHEFLTCFEWKFQSWFMMKDI